MPFVVLQISLSHTNKKAGNTVITTTILMMAPLDIKLHKEPIISILEYIPTPKVAPKKHSPLVTMELIEVMLHLLLVFCPFLLYEVLHIW